MTTEEDYTRSMAGSMHVVIPIGHRLSCVPQSSAWNKIMYTNQKLCTTYTNKQAPTNNNQQGEYIYIIYTHDDTQTGN